MEAVSRSPLEGSSSEQSLSAVEQPTTRAFKIKREATRSLIKGAGEDVSSGFAALFVKHETLEAVERGQRNMQEEAVRKVKKSNKSQAHCCHCVQQ